MERINGHPFSPQSRRLQFQSPGYRSFSSIDAAANDDDDCHSEISVETLKFPNRLSLFEPRDELVIGIDFGTTFTGVAYAHSRKISSVAFASDRRRAAEQVFVVQAWPSPTANFDTKIPSLLSYHTDPPAWGGKVKDNDQLRVAHFKLGLQESLAKHYTHTSRASFSPLLSSYLNDENWEHPALPGKTAADFAGDFLTSVVNHLKNKALPMTYGEELLKNLRTSYVLTVPAIWSDKAKTLTQQAAIAAGIPQQDLMLISEPEAAAHFCISLCEDAALKEGERFLVCDAGGGTVVCSYIN